MNKRIFLSLSLPIVVAACSGDTESSGIGQFFSGEDSDQPVYENQDRNGSCFENDDCMEGFTCEGAEGDTAGTCQVVCAEDADCGNGFLCRSGDCQKDCAEIGEKCSARRVCCFFDENADRVSDAECSGAVGDERCNVPEGVSVSAGVNVSAQVGE